MIRLSFDQGRVIGAMIEKAMTTPANYPMSLNAVVVACNQVSNREPVTEFTDGEVELILRGLTDEGLAKMVHKPGDRVVSCLSMFCGNCRECGIGNTWLCEQRQSLGKRLDGSSRLWRGDEEVAQMTGLGAFAEEMLVHRNAIVGVPDELPLELGALLGCAVITGVGSVFKGAKVQPGSTVAVIGCGGVGLNIVQGAALEGAAVALLSASRRRALDEVVRSIEHVELETHPTFFDFFVDGCQFTPVRSRP